MVWQDQTALLARTSRRAGIKWLNSFNTSTCTCRIMHAPHHARAASCPRSPICPPGIRPSRPTWHDGLPPLLADLAGLAPLEADPLEKAALVQRRAAGTWEHKASACEGMGADRTAGEVGQGTAHQRAGEL